MKRTCDISILDNHSAVFDGRLTENDIVSLQLFDAERSTSDNGVHVDNESPKFRDVNERLSSIFVFLELDDCLLKVLGMIDREEVSMFHQRAYGMPTVRAKYLTSKVMVLCLLVVFFGGKVEQLFEDCFSQRAMTAMMLVRLGAAHRREHWHADKGSLDFRLLTSNFDVLFNLVNIWFEVLALCKDPTYVLDFFETPQSSIVLMWIETRALVKDLYEVLEMHIMWIALMVDPAERCVDGGHLIEWSILSGEIDLFQGMIIWVNYPPTLYNVMKGNSNLGFRIVISRFCMTLHSWFSKGEGPDALTVDHARGCHTLALPWLICIANISSGCGRPTGSRKLRLAGRLGNTR